MSTNNIKIEKNIPIPNGQHSPYRDVFQKMDVGDSFVSRKNSVQSIRNAAKGLDMTVATRSVDDANARVWRVK